MKNKLIIGIAGKSGSGKSTFSDRLKDSNKKNIIIIKMDDYYKNQDELSFEERRKTNYDHPNAFDMDLLIKQISDLKKGKTINKPIYNFVEHNRAKEIQKIEPKKIIILEGLFTLTEPKLRDLLDMKIYIDTDSDECLIRRIKRDMYERGRGLDSILNQYMQHVKPMADSFIEPYKKYADFIVPGTNIDVGIDLLLNKIKKIIKEEE